MSERLDTVLEIDTPEHLAFKVRLAGPARRALAWLIDLLMRALIFGALVLTLTLVFGSLDALGVGAGLMLLGLFVLDWGYFVAWEVLTGGQSAGKRLLMLRVVREGGLPITWRDSVLRNILRAADLVIFPPYVLPFGPMVMALDRRFRRLGDLAAGTIVVVEEPARVRVETAILPDKELVEGLPTSLPLDHDDLEALELFVRRSRMTEARRRELAEIVAPIYAARLGLGPPRDPAAFLASLWARAQDPRRTISR